MAREKEEVKGGFPEPWKPDESGESLEGIYKGWDWIEANKRAFKSYRVQNEETGEFFGVSGGMLKTMLERIPEGTYIWITYLGKIETQNGEAKDYKVECEKGTKLLDPPSSGELPLPEGA